MTHIIDDAIGYVRDHPQMFFRRGVYSTEELASQLVNEALLSGASAVEATRVDEWWVITADLDWFSGHELPDVFHRLKPFPQGGQNAYRAEVLVAAFATDLITIGPDGVRDVVNGTGDALPPLDRPAGGRLVAFR